MKWLAREKIKIGFAMAFALLIGIVVISYRSTRELIETSRWVAHTHLVTRELRYVQTSMENAESSVRGFVITDRRDYLYSYSASIPTIEAHLQKLWILTRDNPDQQLRIAELRNYVTAKQIVMRETVYTREESGFEAAQNAVIADTGKRQMDDIRRVISEMAGEEDELLSRRSLAWEYAEMKMAVVVAFGNLLALSFFTMSLFAINRETATRKQAQKEIRQMNEGLERRVRERTVELEGANKRLGLLSHEHQLILDSVGEGIYGLDLNGNTTFANKVAAKLLGWETTELRGKPMHEISHHSKADGSPFPEDDCPVQRVFQEGSVLHVSDDLFWKRDGTSFPAQYSSTPIWENGQVKGAVVTFSDLTERRRLEEKLHDREELYRVVAETATDAIITINDESIILFVNSAAEQIFGYTAEEMLGQPLTMLMPDIHRAGIDRYKYPGKREITWAGIELPGWHKKGEEIPLEITFGELVKQGKRYFTGIVRDVRERKRAEIALRKSEEKYRLLFEANPHPMWVFDFESLRFLEVNDAAERTFGFSRADFLAMTLNDLCPPEDMESQPEGFFKFGPENAHAGVLRQRKKDGKIIDVEIYSHPIQFGGKLAQLVLANDITERKVLEEQFRQSQKMEAVGRIAGGVAHDFNNLLTIINGYSDLLLESLGNGGESQAQVAEIKKAGDRAAALTRQLLAFSRQQVLTLEIIDLNATVASMDKMLRRVIGEDIDFETHLGTPPQFVKADQGQIEQVIMNLAVNARDAMPKGGKLTIETARVELDEAYCQTHADATPGPHAMLAVSDTGVGMDADILCRIFDPFFTTKEKGKGTGLGLAMVYGTVKQSGGNIWVYSEPGQGTSFKVYFPIVEEVIKRVAPEKSAMKSHPGTETILLVEDEESLRSLARRILEFRGYQVIEASQGEEALSLAQSHEGPLHLLITDVIMPHMSGRELAEHLVQTSPSTKVLYMSGYTDDAIVRHGVLGADVAFIQKPFTPEALVFKVREVLDGLKRG